ncbi:hypothetical protein ZWY2020_057399 [Hordeum vulgare]|nr:hypothetical protein ZWY2020_057399 [Hordeum vulgare]
MQYLSYLGRMLKPTRITCTRRITLVASQFLDLLEKIGFRTIGVGLHVVDDGTHRRLQRLVDRRPNRARHRSLDRAPHHRHDERIELLLVTPDTSPSVDME